MFVEQIQIGNQALQFIDKRIADDKYRGSESSEHNRYDREEIFDTLTLLNEYAPNKTLIRIRDTDLSKRPTNIPEEYQYAHFCEAVKIKIGKGTQDSIRKNIFVDVHRMGLIDRWTIKKKHTVKLEPFQQGSVKYVSLSDEGQRFVNSENILKQSFIFTKALDILLGGYIGYALEILKDPDYDIDKISKYEFMFFVSAINTKTTFNISLNKCVELLKSYRLLSRTQQKAVVETLKVKLVPNNFEGDKTAKRDWHNWQNKIDQVYSLFKQTVYFDTEDNADFLVLAGKNSNKNSKITITRSSDEKRQYFVNHKVDRTAGFELHHVVPLAWATDDKHFKLLDKWNNMLYIDGYSHAKITANNSRNVVMKNDNSTIILSDFANNHVELQIKKNVIYSFEKLNDLLLYNFDLLNIY
jgi:hypothetical protein